MATRMQKTQSSKPYCLICEDTSDIKTIKRVYRSGLTGAINHPSEDYFLCETCIQESPHVWKERQQ